MGEIPNSKDETLSKSELPNLKCSRQEMLTFVTFAVCHCAHLNLFGMRH